MPKENITLPRVLRVLAWSGVAVVVAGSLLNAFGMQLAEALRVSNLTLAFDVSIEYTNYPWYLRLLASLPADLALAYALARLAALLGYAARGEVFSAPAAQHLRSFGVWLLLATLGDLILPTAAQVMNVWVQPPGAYKIRLSLESDSLWRLFFSTLVMLLARVLSDAYRLAEENRQFI